MPTVAKEDNLPVVIKFGGGINTVASEEDLQDRESAAGGQNYRIDLQNRELRPRLPFDLLDTTPDEEEIRGMINLIKSDGTSQILVQTAGGNIYEFGGTAFNSSPIVTGLSATAKLRGRIEHNWNTEDKVLITDLQLQENLKEWDGTNSGFVDVSHNLIGNLKAKYCFVADERAWFGNVNSNGTHTPHAVLASEIDDYTSLATSKPVSSKSESDPFWLLMPDLRAINGMVEAYGKRVFSTKDGQIHTLGGFSAKDFFINSFYPRSGALGDESLAYIGNDIVYGRRGRIESVSATDKFGDVEADDLSRWIKNEIATYNEWVTVYNSRTQSVFFFPVGESQVWEFNKTVYGTNISPWVVHRTQHAMGFNPTCVMNMIDPISGLEYIYMGDSSGNLYRLEGTAGGGDGGTENISTKFISRLLSLETSALMSQFIGYMRYRKAEAFNVDLSFLYAGRKANDETVQIEVEEEVTGDYYGANIYYNDDSYYGAIFTGRLLEQYVGQAGQGETLQIRLEIDTQADFRVNEVGFRFQATQS